MWNDLKSGPVDHDKRDLWFLAACCLWAIPVGAAFWLLGLM